jgi:hypothetical protein
VLFYRRRRAQERSAAQPALPEPSGVRDEEVLRELGAFDEEESSEKDHDGPTENDPAVNLGR